MLAGAASASGPVDPEIARIVDDVIMSRRSVRAFLPTPVPRAVIEQILAVASRAPSGTNMQPWCVYVVSGDAKTRLSRAILDAFEVGGAEHTRPWKYYPEPLFEPYLGRRRAVGWGMYGLLGIGKSDHDKMKAQQAQNFLFFGAPVGMFFTIDTRLEIGSWLDYGMFLQNIMLSARAHGLHTCPQAAFSQYHKIIRSHLDIPDQQTVICGLSIGYEDTTAVVNTLRTDRAPVGEFARFIDYDR